VWEFPTTFEFSNGFFPFTDQGDPQEFLPTGMGKSEERTTGEQSGRVLSPVFQKKRVSTVLVDGGCERTGWDICILGYREEAEVGHFLSFF